VVAAGFEGEAQGCSKPIEARRAPERRVQADAPGNSRQLVAAALDFPKINWVHNASGHLLAALYSAAIPG
jgi:hypothetical protein